MDTPKIPNVYEQFHKLEETAIPNSPHNPVNTESFETYRTARDWTVEFQEILEVLDTITHNTPPQHKIEIYQKMNNLYDDFVSVATMYLLLLLMN